MLCAVILTQYRHLSDRQTDGIAIASTVLAMRAIAARCKNIWTNFDKNQIKATQLRQQTFVNTTNHSTQQISYLITKNLMPHYNENL